MKYCIKPWILVLIMIPVWVTFFSCDNDEEKNRQQMLYGNWELTNIAADVNAGDDMEKALIQIDLVTTAFPKTGSVITFYTKEDFLIVTHDKEQITGRYTFSDDKLDMRFDNGGKTHVIVWISGNTMRMEEDYTSHYKYDNTPYPSVEKVIKINHLIHQTGNSPKMTGI